MLDNGRISVNTAPSVPASITVPGSVRGGTNVNVSWGASSDTQGNISGYKLERGYNNGNWSQVAQINSLSSSQPVTKGWNNVAFRVRAFDSDGAHSDYRTSGWATVINNVAPTVPASITVPASVRGGQNANITWGASTDEDGNLSGYRLERAINNDNNSWTQVAQVNAQSSSQPITKGWNTVAFRVRAYDAGGLNSDYRTSGWATVINNVAPTTPPSINVPGTIKGGSTITVSWGGSTDEDGNLSGYKLEHQVNGGGWSATTTTPNTSYNHTVTKGWNTIAYRVRAYDAGGLESANQTSATRTIINNTAPLAPSTITVPATVKGGERITVSWAAAYDEDNNVTGYTLERQFNGGAWAQVAQLNALQSQQDITKGWNTVAFRVKAFDAGNLESPYKTSETRTVTNNTAPTISGSDTNLGDSEAPPDYRYTVTDPDAGQTLSVTETLTNGSETLTLRSFSAVSGQDNTVNLNEVWLRLLKGEHRLTISVSDGEGGTATRTVTFGRTVSRIACSRSIPTERPVQKCMISFFPSDLPEDAVSLCEVSNNPFDEQPVWEQYHRPGQQVHIFQNATVNAAPGLALRRSINRPGGGVEFAQAVVHYAMAEGAEADAMMGRQPTGMRGFLQQMGITWSK